MGIVQSTVDAVAEDYNNVDLGIRPPGPQPISQPSASDLIEAYKAYHQGASPDLQPSPDTSFMGGAVGNLPGYEAPPPTASDLSPEGAQAFADFDQRQQQYQAARSAAEGYANKLTGGALGSLQKSIGQAQGIASGQIGVTDNIVNVADFPSEQDAIKEAQRRSDMGVQNVRVVYPNQDQTIGQGVTEGLTGLNEAIAAPARGVSNMIRDIPTGGETLGERINNAPGIVSIPANFALDAAPYVAADAATGGALTPVFVGQAGLQTAQIGAQYAQGQISGEDALKQLALTVGPILLAPAIHTVIKAVPKFAEYATSPEGQAVIAKLQSEAGSTHIPGTPEEPVPSAAETEHAQNTADALGRAQETADSANPFEGAPSRQEIGFENISRNAKEVAADAQNRGASPELAQALAQTMNATDFRTQGPDTLLEAGKPTQLIAKTAARLTGSIPGQVGKIIDQNTNFGYVLTADRTNILKGLAKDTAGAIEQDTPNLKFIGSDAAKIAEASSPEAYAFEFPQEFTGWNPKTLDLIQQTKAAQQGHFALLQAVDPTTAKSVTSYLPHVYAGEDMSPLITPIERQRGEVGIAQKRAYPDWRVAVDNGLKMQKMPLLNQIEYGLRKADQGVDDALFRKSVLEKFGTNDAKVAKANGWTAVRNPILTRPEEGPWYVPKEINNFIDQRYAPPTGMVASARGISAKLKGVLTFPLDIAGLAQRIREIGTVNPFNLGAGVLHRVLTSDEGEIPRNTQYALDGVPQGAAGSIASESSGFFGKTHLGAKASELNQAPWQALTGMRNLAHEGNLAIMKALGMDVSPDTATGVANRQASAAIVRAFSGASKGAQRLGRDAIEKAALLSQQNTRAYFSQIGALSNLLRPGANAAQRLLAAQGVASLATGVWGVGSLLNMEFGDGKALKFPVTWDGDKFVYNPDWDMIKIGGASTPMLPQATLANAIAKSFAVVGTQVASQPTSYTSDANALGEAVKPFAQFGLGRTSPLVNAPLAAAGYGYDDTGKPHFGDLTAPQRIRAAVPEPISASKLFQDPSAVTNPGELAAEQLAGALPPNEDIERVKSKTALKDKLDQAGYNKADTAFKSPFWQKKFDSYNSGQVKPKDYDTIAEWKKAYLDKWAGDDPVKRHEVELKFNAYAPVKEYNKAANDYQFNFWKNHRDWLREALALKLVQPSKELDKLLTSPK